MDLGRDAARLKGRKRKSITRRSERLQAGSLSSSIPSGLLSSPPLDPFPSSSPRVPPYKFP